MRRYWIGILALVLAACSTVTGAPTAALSQVNSEMKPSATVENSSAERVLADLPSLGPAPELENETWLNVEKPLRLEELRGKVVLLDMWTFG
jgi:hypothetical protein